MCVQKPGHSTDREMWRLQAYFNNQHFGGYTTRIELSTTGKKDQGETTEISTSGDINVGNQLTNIILQSVVRGGVKFCCHHAKNVIINPIC